MKLIEKHKLEKILEKVESGQFDENDIDNLFIKLRPYYKGFKKFKEIADFVAHNDERDRGLLNQALEHRYLMMKYFIDYVYDNDAEPLDMGKPFPAWVIKLLKYQSEFVDKQKFLQDYKQSITSFLKKVDQVFKINEKEKTALYIGGSVSELFLSGLKECLHFISFRPAFNQDDLIKEILGVLKANKINFNKDKIKYQSDKITICILLLMHNATYTYNKKELGSSYITYENLIEIANNPSQDIGFGRLIIGGLIKIELKKGVEREIHSPLLFTNLIAEQWCDAALISTEIKENGIKIKKLSLEENLVLNHSSKLSIKN
ncbi:hypothetical protein OHV46_08720 [Acinetobacter baumannii]|nr:hypothetical protein [Acinetobacter baumannii]